MAPSYSKIRPKAPHGRTGRTFNRDGQVTAPSGDQRSGDPGKVPQIAPWLNLGEHPNSTEKRLGFIPNGNGTKAAPLTRDEARPNNFGFKSE